MIIVRAPLRLTFGGGGTDLPSFANIHTGFCVSATISRYVYIAVNHSFSEGILLRYSSNEKVEKVDQITHPIFKEALKDINLATPQVEVVSVADVPSNGAGLGNSGAFTVALLKSLYSYKNIPITSKEIAEKACDINMNKLNKTQGKQDEYISAYGGIAGLTFNQDGSVLYESIPISHKTMVELEENLMLFYTNFSHNSENILNYQDVLTKQEDAAIVDNLKIVKKVGINARRFLMEGKLEEFGDLLNLQWELKEDRMPDKNEILAEVHYGLLSNGAIGSKIIGSGGGGFIMVYASKKGKVRDYMRKKGMEEMRFTFDFEGCKRVL